MLLLPKSWVLPQTNTGSVRKKHSSLTNLANLARNPQPVFFHSLILSFLFHGCDLKRAIVGNELSFQKCLQNDTLRICALRRFSNTTRHRVFPYTQLEGIWLSYLSEAICPLVGTSIDSRTTTLH